MFGSNGPQPDTQPQPNGTAVASAADGLLPPDPNDTHHQSEPSMNGAASVEEGRVPELAAAIRAATQFVDIHSSSAVAPAFAFHWPGAAEFAATFPVAYAVETSAIPGITTDLANHQVHRCSIPRLNQHCESQQS